MDIRSIVAVMLITVIGAILLHWLGFRVSSGRPVGLRPLPGYVALKTQSGRAVESGRGVHFSLGRASLVSPASPASIAALTVLDYLTEDGCASDVPPLTTSGDGTLMLAAQDSLRGAFNSAGRQGEYDPILARFLAGSEFAAAYAAGASDVVNGEKLGSNLLLGHYGPEVAIIAEAGERKELQQVIGSDDPTAMALAVAATDKVLLGEELFVAGAYLQGKPAQVASLQLQDVMRVIAIVGILLAALFNIVVG
jgi:hypothetical protein